MTVPTDLDRRFRDAAVEARLLDAGYDVVDTPVGPLLVAATDRGLLRVSFDGGGGDPEAALEQIARLVGPRVLRAPRAVAVAHAELDEYFSGKRRAFDLPVDLRGQPGFAVSVLGELAGTTQVLFFTHHARLCELAREAVPADVLREHRLR